MFKVPQCKCRMCASPFFFAFFYISGVFCRVAFYEFVFPGYLSLYFNYMLIFFLFTIKKDVIKYCENVYERSSQFFFWLIQNSCEAISKLKSGGFHTSSLSTYDFSTL